MEDIVTYIATGHTSTSAHSSLINIRQCNRSVDTDKLTSENHESTTGTANIYSLYTISDNI